MSADDGLDKARQALELAINEMAADTAVVKATLQAFILNIAMAGRPETLQELRAQVLAILGQAGAHDTDLAPGADRSKQLTLMRAELLFQEIEEAAGLTSDTGGPSKAN